MEYNLNINDRTDPVHVDITGDTGFDAATPQEEFEVSFARISDHQISLQVNGQTFNAHVTRTEDAKIIMIEGRTFTVRDADLAERTKSGGRGMASTETEVTPPMPAVVILVAVKPGDHVEKGDPVVTLSAMKMETTLTAPYSGEVTSVNVAEGDKVMPGQILIDIQS
ncbi:MAG: biotin/lipoyl-binding protein [Desulfobacteraceae bacterium]|nr:biotin/lipoyl-binding protein [Desulfobacteraceae bacterium]